MAIVDAHEFVEVMAMPLFHAAAIASGKRNLQLIEKKAEPLPGSEREIDRASRVDVLSEVDLRIQEMLLSIVFEHWPMVSVLVEEDTSMKTRFPKSSAAYVLIDPVDGTRNYLRGDRRYCHIVSLVSGTQMLATLLYSHAASSLFVAVRGVGAQVLSVHNEAHPAKITSSPTRTVFHHVSRISENVMQEISSDGFTLAVSAQNATDIITMLAGEASGFISYMPLVYDVWSPGMIIEEAGGWLSDWCGRPLVFEGRARLPHVLIAASSDIAARLIKSLSKHL